MTMKARELADLDAEELAAKLAEAKEELFNLRFQNVTGQLDDPHRLREVRKDIARIFTVIRQRELAGEVEPAAAEQPAERGFARRRTGRKERS
jgi:large subunit ribosomal protein L29